VLRWYYKVIAGFGLLLNSTGYIRKQDYQYINKHSVCTIMMCVLLVLKIENRSIYTSSLIFQNKII